VRRPTTPALRELTEAAFGSSSSGLLARAVWAGGTPAAPLLTLATVGPPTTAGPIGGLESWDRRDPERNILVGAEYLAALRCTTGGISVRVGAPPP
jgi:hypothetical protein